MEGCLCLIRVIFSMLSFLICGNCPGVLSRDQIIGIHTEMKEEFNKVCLEIPVCWRVSRRSNIYPVRYTICIFYMG